MANSNSKANASGEANVSRASQLAGTSGKPVRGSNAGSSGSAAGKPSTSGGGVTKVKARMRCGQCGIRLTLSTSFTCRCRKQFCPKHRYPEEHACTFDYKALGRKQLEDNNPLVVAPKIDKI
uniref:AN1-type zinc finger protein 4 n=1 Tax=Cacopsylla melanoneura TaxID=428564 RepID=A0A8D8TTK9_9HEMI